MTNNYPTVLDSILRVLVNNDIPHFRQNLAVQLNFNMKLNMFQIGSQKIKFIQQLNSTLIYSFMGSKSAWKKCLIGATHCRELSSVAVAEGGWMREHLWSLPTYRSRPDRYLRQCLRNKATRSSIETEIERWKSGGAAGRGKRPRPAYTIITSNSATFTLIRHLKDNI